ncbi:MAG: type II toxin-antitoxin system ParD family antitoxin [Alphaproteobacteria bacterium]|jgi:antitoxin ParD1/3/4|nr:type II toxin-antitoxin system ParD family antitoxin [Alphaproteobacteria bacterium]
MNVSLTPRLVEYVRQKVDAGLYGSSSEVIRAALRLMEERDRQREAALVALRGEEQQSPDHAVIDPVDLFDKLKNAVGGRV